MSVVLNTNMASLYAQKSLSTAQTELASSVQRLSSGTRINSSKDDGAGYAVSQGIASTKNIADQSVRNVQDAISTVQIAQGALELVSKMLQRVLTLATQKEDGSLSTSQKSSINSEIVSLLNEVNKVQSRTKLQNSQNALFGSTEYFSTGNTSLSSINIAALSLGGTGSYTPSNAALVQGQTYSLNIADSSPISGSLSYIVLDSSWISGGSVNAEGITFQYNASNTITPSAGTSVWYLPHALYQLQAIRVQNSALANVGDAIYINGVNKNTTVMSIIDGNTIVTSLNKNMTDNTNPIGISAGNTVSFGSAVATGTLALDNSTLPARTIYFDNRTDFAKAGGNLVSGAYNGPTILSTTQWSAIYDTNLSLDGSPNPSVWYHTTIASASAISTGGLGLVADAGFTATSAHDAGFITNSDYYDGSGNILNLSSSSVDSLSKRNIFNAIAQNSANYSDLGSQLNRLDYIVDNLQTLSNNLAEAQSRILDTNYAAETSALTRGQILQQASTSALAAANMAPNVALNILNNDGLSNDSKTRLRGG